MQNKVVRLHASGGDNRFRARFSQSLTDCQRPSVYVSVRYVVAGGFLVWFSFRFVFTVARENKRENGGGGSEGQPEKTTCILPAFNFPLAHRFLVQLRVRFRAADLSLNEPQKEKNTPKNKPPATQATRKGKSIYGKRQLAATDHYFPSFTCYLFFFCPV